MPLKSQYDCMSVLIQFIRLCTFLFAKEKQAYRTSAHQTLQIKIEFNDISFSFFF